MSTPKTIAAEYARAAAAEVVLSNAVVKAQAAPAAPAGMKS